MSAPDIHPSVFDAVASGYDEQFTHSWIGRAQRASVYAYLDTILSGWEGQVLELNCGTGEDAIWLAKRGLRVTCTDISEKMIEMVNGKIAVFPHPDRIEAFVAGFQDVANLPQKQYDLVFSNFGGLNCIAPDQLKAVSKDLISLTQSEARLVIVLMGKNCLWEQAYFLLKGQWGKAFRRWRGKALARLDDGHHQMTWYPSIREVRRQLRDDWEVLAIRPIGLLVPPSFLEPMARRFPRICQLLARWENRLSAWSFTARFSDHYLIDLKRKA